MTIKELINIHETHRDCWLWTPNNMSDFFKFEYAGEISTNKGMLKYTQIRDINKGVVQFKKKYILIALDKDYIDINLRELRKLEENDKYVLINGKCELKYKAPTPEFVYGGLYSSNKKNKIDFNIKVVGTTVQFYINYMDERFRTESESIKKIYNTNILNIYSSSHIQLLSTAVYLLGYNTKQDKDVATLKFDTKSEAIRYRAKVIRSIGLWAKNWEGFKEEIKPLKEDYSF